MPAIPTTLDTDVIVLGAGIAGASVAFFLAPMALLVLYLSWPIFVNSFLTHEQSSNAGGLTVWPVRLLVPVGFALLILQAASEFIKRVAFLKGLIDDPSAKHKGPSAEEELAEAIRRQRGEEA